MGLKGKGRREVAPPTREVAPRRVPIQARGRQRVDQILDAAAQVFDEQGYDAATTNAIAERAGVPIGSVYQFFPNKSALFHALAARYRDEVLRVFEQKTAGSAAEGTPFLELVHRVIDAIVHFHRTRPGFRSLISAARTTPELVAGVTQLLEVFEKRMAALIAGYAPTLPAPERELMAAVSVRIADALMVLASRRHGTPDAAVIAQMKLVLDRYLGPLAPAQNGRKRG